MAKADSRRMARQPLVNNQRMPAASDLGDGPCERCIGNAGDDDLDSHQAAHALADADPGRPAGAEKAVAVGVFHRHATFLPCLRSSRSYCAIRQSAAFVGLLFALERSGVTMLSAQWWTVSWWR
jgi:hypothetical protein